jgi:fatty-acyl-CoA synthase
MAKTTTLRALGDIRSIADVEALEAFPYDDLITARSVYDLFLNTARFCGNRPSVTVLRSAEPSDIEVTLSHSELLRQITKAANLFTSLGVGEDDVIAIVSKTHGPIPALVWGAETAGIVSCLNYLLAREVLVEILRREAAKILVCPSPTTDPEIWGRVSGIIEHVPSLRYVVLIGENRVQGAKFISLADGLERQSAERLLAPRKINRESIAALFHTGGTTGSPKLVPQTHGNQIHAAWSMAQSLGNTEQDIGLNGLPFFHVGGASAWGLAMVAAGGHLVVLSPIGYRDPHVVRNIWKIVRYFRATIFGAVPTTIGAMVNIPIDNNDISTLRLTLTGGASISSSVADRFEAMVRVPLVEQYGMTETVTAIACAPPRGRRQRGAVGLRHPFSEVRVVKDPFADILDDCAPNETGNVICRGRQVISSYVDRRHNIDAFTPSGYLVTGDVGHFTEDSQLVLTGRKKDLIIRGGHNIDPAAIEEVASAHPAVAASAAVGMPDAYAGEIPVLFVVARSDKDFNLEELAKYMEVHTPEPPARPRHIFKIDQLPITAVGKIYKPSLREMAIIEKLRIELTKIDGGLKLVNARFSSGISAGTKVAFAVNATASVVPQSTAKQRLEEAVRDLTIETEIEWL